jgi:hypothetical protein
MASRNPTNRIEVDLKLLQDNNVEKLQQFGKDFDKSISALATMVGSFSQQVEGAQRVNKPGEPGPNASQAGSVRIDSVPARMGGVSTVPGAVGSFANQGQQYGGGGGASVAPPSGNPDTFEQQYIKAQRRIGEVPVGFRQTLGYFGENVQEGDSPFTTTLRGGARRVNEALFNMQAVKTNVMLAQNQLQGLYSSVAVPTALGQQLGASRGGGFLGTGLFSSAWMRGLSETWHTAAMSKFGFSPNYSPSQAAQARQTLESFGYSGDTANMLGNYLKELQIHRGLGPDVGMAVLDPFMRYGGPENMQQLAQTLADIPGAASAARMNLSQFTQALMSTAQQVAQATGMSMGGATQALQSFSSITGLSPERGGALLQNANATTMASALTGRTVTSLMEGGNKMAPRMAYGLSIFEQTIGMPISKLMQLRKTNIGAYNRAADMAWRMYLQDPSVFAGLSPRELENLFQRNEGRPLQHMAIREKIQNIQGTSQQTVGQIENLLGQWGGSQGQQLQTGFNKWLAAHPNMDPNQLRTEAAKEIDKFMGTTASRKAARSMTIELSTDAKKYFRLVGTEDASARNASPGGFARPSSGPGSSSWMPGQAYGGK